MDANARALRRPIRIVLRWQLVATIALTLMAGLMAGAHGALSAAAGGLVSMAAGLASAVVASRGATKSAGGILAGALTAEAMKLGIAAFLLWVVLANYEEVVVAGFLASFVATMLVFSMAFFVRED
jgi:ATP synthase protein I